MENKNISKEEVNVNAIHGFGRTSAHRAAMDGDTEKLKVCKKADIKAKDNLGRTPAHLAARGGQTGALRCLRELGANVKAKDNYALTPAHFAAQNGQTGALRCLRELGANINTGDNEGRTPAHWAIMGEHLEALKYLVEEVKIDVNIINKNGDRLLDIAYFYFKFKWEGMKEIINLLKKAGAKTSEELREEKKQKAAFVERAKNPCYGKNKVHKEE